jgi:hypothetical protein
MLPILSTVPNPETIAHLAALTAEEADYQADIQQAREYYDGQQFVHLTERLRQFLGGDTSNTTEDYKRLRLNVYRTVIRAVLERLIVQAFTTDEQGSEEPVLDEAGNPVPPKPDGTPVTQVAKPVQQWAWRVWQRNRMDARQSRIYEATLRDGEAFVIVDWDDINKLPRFTPHPRYIDAQAAGGDSFGCKAFYQNDDPDQQLLYVTKRWTEVLFDNAGNRSTRQRLTIYYPDRIEKYAGSTAAWQEIRDPSDTAWPIPWVDGTGQPLGIPVVHFRSTAGMEAHEAIGAQNAINKLIVDLLQASDMTAFRILIALGWQPVDANGDPLTIEPGRWIGTTNPNGKTDVVDGADLSNIIEVVNQWIYWLAMVTDTPVSRFITTAQVAAEGTLKQQEGPLVNKIRARSTEIGNALEDMLSIARRLHNTFGGTPALDETVIFDTQWAPFETRDEKAELESADIKINKLNIPAKVVWGELGYSDDKIATWEAEAQRKAQEDMQAQIALMQAKGGQQDNGNNQSQAGQAVNSAAG